MSTSLEHICELLGHEYSLKLGAYYDNLHFHIFCNICGCISYDFDWSMNRWTMSFSDPHSYSSIAVDENDVPESVVLIRDNILKL